MFDDIRNLLLLTFIALQVLDGITTYVSVSRGGIELNPLMRFVIEDFGLKTGLVSTKIVVIIAGVLMLPAPWWVLGLLNLVYLIIVIHNVKQLRWL